MDENAKGGMSDGGGGNWAQFDAPGQLKKDIEAAWNQLSDKRSCPYEVVITVVGNNPLSGYSVSLKPTG